MTSLLLLSGYVAAGFCGGLLVARLFRRRTKSVARILRAWNHRKHSQRTLREFKLRFRPRYSTSSRQFRFDPKDNRGW